MIVPFEKYARLEAKKQRRAEREIEVAAKIRALPDRRYGVIYADPPWKFKTWSQNGDDRGASNHYPTMTLDQILTLAVPCITADDCVLFLWATAPMLPQALAVMEAWGFTYKTNVCWIKDRISTGYWFRGQHELLLIGTRGKIPPPAMGSQYISVILAVTERHSVKPERFHQIIEGYFPNTPKIELFSNVWRPGWDCWGAGH